MKNTVLNSVEEVVRLKLCEMTQIPADQIHSKSALAKDLGLDSVDIVDLIAYLDDYFSVPDMPVQELSTVGQLIAWYKQTMVFSAQLEEEKISAAYVVCDEMNRKGWKERRKRIKTQALPASGITLPEVFLNCCKGRMKLELCADDTAGILTYADAKLRVILLAEFIRHFRGDYIGILLPSSVAAYLTVLACQLAGKIPLLINWTMGRQHFESVISLSNVKVILSSSVFLEKLKQVDISPLSDFIVTLEEIKQKTKIKDKLKAFFRSKWRTSSLLSLFKINKKSDDDIAVLLFTSGTENIPKGVPLSHGNILSNQRGALERAQLTQDDILFGMLPPFHSFGFTISGLLPLLCGMRAIYFPNPTEGAKIAQRIAHWNATVLCGAPTFLKGIFHASHVHQLRTLRYCFTGGEKAPDELFQLVHTAGHCHLLEGYGITECSPIITLNMGGERENGVGKPLFGISIRSVHVDTYQPLKTGEQGLILAKGPNIFKGYLNPTLVSPFIKQEDGEWYSTGDLGTINSEGALLLSGRLKRFIKIAGEMISLSAIEEALRQKAILNGRKEEEPLVAVCSYEQAGYKPKVVLYARFSITVVQANQWLREFGFSNLVKISEVKEVSHFPLMGSGKIHYRELQDSIYSS